MSFWNFPWGNWDMDTKLLLLIGLPWDRNYYTHKIIYILLPVITIVSPNSRKSCFINHYRKCFIEEKKRSPLGMCGLIFSFDQRLNEKSIPLTREQDLMSGDVSSEGMDRRADKNSFAERSGGKIHLSRNHLELNGAKDVSSAGGRSNGTHSLFTFIAGSR